MEVLSDKIHARMNHYHVSGLSMATMRNGQKHLSEGYGYLESGTDRKVGLSTRFNACSISKMVTAMLVLKLVDQGTLDLARDIQDWLITWKAPQNEYTLRTKVTLQWLLSHQAGIVDSDGSFGQYDRVEGIPTMLDLLEGRKSYCPEPVVVSYEPVSDFNYSDAGFCIIEQIIEDVTGKAFKSLLVEMIFEPLGMINSTIEYTLSDGDIKDIASGHYKDGTLVDGKYPSYPYPAAAGLWTTPTDLTCLLVEVVNSLQGTGKLGISKELMKEMVTPQGCAHWAGLGVFLGKSEQDHIQVSSLGWGIGFQSMLVFYPELGTGAVIMINSDLGIHQTKGIIGEIVDALELHQT